MQDQSTWIRNIQQIFQNDIWKINQLGFDIYNKYLRITYANNNIMDG